MSKPRKALRWFRAAGPIGALFALPLHAASTNEPPEFWLTNEVTYPQAVASARVQTNRFAQLRTEYLAETVRILWTPPAGDAAGQARLRLSADEPGHWPARDWRSYPMARRGPSWEAIVPVDSLEAPLVYFVETESKPDAGVSPMRLCRPRLLGLEMPTRIFWPFLEGFEEGFESWRWLAGGPKDGQFQTSTNARNGKAALLVSIPPGRTSVTIGSTRLRGWHMLEHDAAGVSVWLRARAGPGEVRFALLANAFSANQVVATRPAPTSLRDQWQEVELPFHTFSRFLLSELDFFTLEFLGPPGTEFLVDDLQMLGRWFLR